MTNKKGAEHEKYFEEAALELVGIVVGGQPHWKFIEKQFIEKLKLAHAAGKKEALEATKEMAWKIGKSYADVMISQQELGVVNNDSFQKGFAAGRQSVIDEVVTVLEFYENCKRLMLEVRDLPKGDDLPSLKSQHIQDNGDRARELLAKIKPQGEDMPTASTHTENVSTKDGNSEKCT